MRNQLLACAVLGALATTAAADDKKYTLADLKALVSQKSYAEAVGHLTDIPPSERNADFLAVAADAAVGYLGTADSSAKIYAFEMFDTNLPILLKSPKYAKARVEGVAGFESCLRGYSRIDCFERAFKFVDADPNNAELALKMAKLIRRNSTPAAAAAGFFKRAVAAAGKNTAALCKDADLKQTVVSGFNLPDSYDDSTAAREIASGACWSELKSTVVEEFKKASESSYERLNTCAILKAKNSLSADQTRACERAKKSE